MIAVEQPDALDLGVARQVEHVLEATAIQPRLHVDHDVGRDHVVGAYFHLQLEQRVDVGAAAEAQHGARLAHAVNAAHDIEHEVVERADVVDEAGEAQVGALAQPVGPQRRHTVAAIVAQVVEHLLAGDFVLAAGDIHVDDGQDRLARWCHRVFLGCQLVTARNRRRSGRPAAMLSACAV